MSVKVDDEVDIRGEVCPYTFVRSKLKLETMPTGHVLRIITDHEPATRNVPKSMENEGHQLISSPHKINDTDWEFLVKKQTE
ncbi:MAG TPA: sulfurtransferase TusA family protein [Nitrospinota bacterium]|mgnify:FL=1|jgi:TusA-related sulfurtransferase|nr:sulfurtransferase TusA family protein [Nitrospinota bacterium]|tara:strand:- start:252684 stop:252929 length:246 start_codon:yes stop_codon:yes gene_type:complete